MIYAYRCENIRCRKFNRETYINKSVSEASRHERCRACHSFLDRIYSTAIAGLNFIPYYDRVLRATVTSYKEQEKLAHAHRSPSHPEGLMLASDDKKFIQECKHIHKHKEEYKAANWSGYKAGSKVKYDEKAPDKHRVLKRVTVSG